MSSARWIVLTAPFALLCVGQPLARAENLDCAQFRDRLDRTITAMGDHVAHPGTFTLRYDSGASGKRFEWNGIVGLSGTMTCSGADAFEDFGIAISDATRTSDDLPLVLKRFMALASATVCTIAEATPEACRTLVQTMTTGSLSQFKDAAAKGEAVPMGTRDFFIVKGVDAEIDMTPVGISWSIGPGLSMTTDALKQKLEPRNVDE